MSFLHEAYDQIMTSYSYQRIAETSKNQQGAHLYERNITTFILDRACKFEHHRFEQAWQRLQG